jgi:DNA-binding transcriptional MerR regulator
MKTRAETERQPKTMTIGQLASRASVTTYTIRYYEKIGILRDNERAANGYRMYTERDLYALRLVRRAKLLGVSLSEMKELAPALWEDATEMKLIEGSIEVLSSHMEKARKKIRDLEAYADTVEREIVRMKGLL